MTSDYAVVRDERITMRDGVPLLADVFEPHGRSAGTMLMISPYGWGLGASAMYGGMFAGRGYRVVLVRCRGTFGSGGTFDPFRQERDDAADIVGWLRTQPWFDGRFGTYGYSYIGYTQWALLMDSPPEMVAAVIACSPFDWGAYVYQGGALLLSTLFEWSFITTKQEKPIVPRMAGVLGGRGTVRKALATLPLADTDGVFNGQAPWYREWISRRDPTAEWWQSANLSQALDRVQIPVLLQGGWQDGFLRPIMAAYRRLADRGVDVGLTIGPWTHAQGGAQGTRVLLPDALAWLDEHLANSGVHHRAAPVRTFVSGPDKEWRDLPSWPPPTVEQVWYPRAGTVLAKEPAADGETSEFTYDPSNPTPTYGGTFVTQISPGLTDGYTDDSALATRPDVLAFTSEPLTTTLEVIGTPILELAHASDNPCADLFVRVSEVDQRGHSRNVSDGFVRLRDHTPVIRLELDPVAHRFARGNRIRLLIAGGSHPRWERNLGTTDNPATSTTMRPSHRTIDLAASRLTIPTSHMAD